MTILVARKEQSQQDMRKILQLLVQEKYYKVEK